MIDKQRISALFGGCGISLTARQLENLDGYAQLLVDWNQKINLTALTSPTDIEQKHFLDSVLPFYMEDGCGLPQGSKLLDVGTGAGFPSCPLKIMRPDIDITLLDSLNKRIGFLKELSDKLGLGAECIHGRAEELGRNAYYREKFDVVTARAVAKLSELCEYCMPFVKVGGVFAALKGSGGEEELAESKRAINTLGGTLLSCKVYKLPCGDGRTLIVIRKTSPTPEKYPRDKGRIKKKPL